MQRQVDLCESETSLVYRASSRIAMAAQRNPVLKNTPPPILETQVPVSFHFIAHRVCFSKSHWPLKTDIVHLLSFFVNYI